MKQAEKIVEQLTELLEIRKEQERLAQEIKYAGQVADAQQSKIGQLQVEIALLERRLESLCSQ